MDYSGMLRKFGKQVADEDIAGMLGKVNARAGKNQNRKVYGSCFGCLDLTSLGSGDTHEHIEQMTLKAVDLKNHFPGVPNVASVCVFPVFVETAGLVIGESDIAITSVAGGFPSSQTFLEVKMLEASMAVENGADEIDVVMSVGQFLSGAWDEVGGELETIRGEIGPDTVFKVIIESGLLDDPLSIRRASLIAMAAGADFVKTSTGKAGPGATPEAAVVMCGAIKDYYAATGRKVGFKAAGGVSTAHDAALYYTIVEEILGCGWLSPDLFRIGASALADNLLSEIGDREVKYF